MLADEIAFPVAGNATQLLYQVRDTGEVRIRNGNRELRFGVSCLAGDCIGLLDDWRFVWLRDGATLRIHDASSGAEVWRAEQVADRAVFSDRVVVRDDAGVLSVWSAGGGGTRVADAADTFWSIDGGRHVAFAEGTTLSVWSEATRERLILDMVPISARPMEARVSSSGWFVWNVSDDYSHARLRTWRFGEDVFDLADDVDGGWRQQQSFSPDGNALAYLTTSGELRVALLPERSTTTIAAEAVSLYWLRPSSLLYVVGSDFAFEDNSMFIWDGTRSAPLGDDVDTRIRWPRDGGRHALVLRNFDRELATYTATVWDTVTYDRVLDVPNVAWACPHFAVSRESALLFHRTSPGHGDLRRWFVDGRPPRLLASNVPLNDTCRGRPPLASDDHERGFVSSLAGGVIQNVVWDGPSLKTLRPHERLDPFWDPDWRVLVYSHWSGPSTVGQTIGLWDFASMTERTVTRCGHLRDWPRRGRLDYLEYGPGCTRECWLPDCPPECKLSLDTIGFDGFQDTATVLHEDVRSMTLLTIGSTLYFSATNPVDGAVWTYAHSDPD